MKNLPCGEMSTAVVEEFDIEDNKHLPGDETVVEAGESHDELITYLMVSKNNKGDLTKNTDVDRFYDRIIWSNPGSYYSGVVEQFEKSNGCYTNSDNIMYLIKNALYSCKIRLLFDDGG